jgi:hypothetical protein
MHGNRVINVGGHDAAYSGYLQIKADGGLPIVTGENDSKEQQPIKLKAEENSKLAKWWEFWKN